MKPYEAESVSCRANVVGSRIREREEELSVSKETAANLCGMVLWRYMLIRGGFIPRVFIFDEEIEAIAKGLGLNVRYLSCGEEQDGKCEAGFEVPMPLCNDKRTLDRLSQHPSV